MVEGILLKYSEGDFQEVRNLMVVDRRERMHEDWTVISSFGVETAEFWRQRGVSLMDIRTIQQEKVPEAVLQQDKISWSIEKAWRVVCVGNEA